MPKEPGPRFSVDPEGNTKDNLFSRFFNELEDIKNNAAREAGTDKEAFWENTKKGLRNWALDDIYNFVVSWNNLNKQLLRTWENPERLLSVMIEVYREKGGKAPWNISRSGKEIQ